jgi:pterin-4a-carbinolamine dehydratase
MIKAKRYELRMKFDEAWAVLELIDMWTEKWPHDPTVNKVHRRLERLLLRTASVIKERRAKK